MFRRLHCFGLLIFFAVSCTQANLGEESAPGLCNDDFNRADGTGWGSNWDFVSAGGLMDMQISGQKGVVRFLGGGSFMYGACAKKIDQTKTVHSGRISVLTTIDYFLGIVARAQSKATLANAYFCGIDGSAFPENLLLFKAIGGQRIVMGISTTVFTVSPGNEYLMTFSLLGNDLKCSIAGAANAEVFTSDVSFRSGITGVYGHQMSNQNMQFALDDFRIETRE